MSLTAYADDVTVILQSQEDVKLLSQVLQTYQRAASAKINREKCSSFLIGDWQDSTRYCHNVVSGIWMVLRFGGISRNCCIYG